MGKSSKYPSYTTGTVSVNGNTLAKSNKSGDTVSSSYYMPETEKGIYDYAQNALLSSLPQVNVFSQSTQDDINSQLEAYKNRGVEDINNTYNPMINTLKNDIASRFGNLNNSAFLDKLNSIEKNRALALSDFEQDLQAQRSNLYNNELANRYDYLNLMNTLQNQITNNILNYMQLAQSNSSSGNSYNNAAYNSTNNTENKYLNSALNAARLSSLFL